MSDLQKLFVLVPSTSDAKVADIKTASLSTNKVYFMAKYNQIVAKGAVYGVDPSTGKELETLVTVIGGTKGADGTVTVDFSNLNYYTSEGTKTIIGAIEAVDAKIKAEMDKLAASKTLNEKYGHEAGDNQIRSVASVLIRTQKDNTEILRTDGDEFMIYLVGYDEKKVGSYIHKLNREIQSSLSNRDYGVSIGYSMINSEQTTIDDAINDSLMMIKKSKGSQK